MQSLALNEQQSKLKRRQVTPSLGYALVKLQVRAIQIDIVTNEFINGEKCW